MKKNEKLQNLIDLIAKIFTPIIPVLTAAGILKGLLVMATTLGILQAESGTYQILFAMADGFFYFLPAFIGFSGAKEFGANSYTGVFVALALLHPNLVEEMHGDTGLFLGGMAIIPVTYSFSILPIFMAMACLGKVEPWIEKRLPEVIRAFGTPLCSGLIVYFMTLLVFGPFGSWMGGILAAGYQWCYQFTPTVAGIAIGALIQPMVICGFHWSIFPICVENIAILGEDTLMAIMSAGIFSQAGAAFAMMFKTSNNGQKTICLSGMVAAILGTTEPAIFGANLPRKTPFLLSCIGGGVGGGIIGFSGASAKAFALPSLVITPMFIGDGFGLFLVGCLAAFVVAFGLVMMLVKKS